MRHKNIDSNPDEEREMERMEALCKDCVNLISNKCEIKCNIYKRLIYEIRYCREANY